jgi:hypothetical protein
LFFTLPIDDQMRCSVGTHSILERTSTYMRTNKLLLLPFLAGAVTLAAQNCTTPSGATDSDGSVSASASFTVGAGFITVTVANGLADPRSAGQLLNGVAFTLSSGPATATLGSTSANLRRVNSDGTFTDLGPAATGWALDTNFNGGLMLCVLCSDLGGSGPSHLLIGNPAVSGTYASANRSIAGNKPHNPFDSGTATFLINVPGLSPSATVTGATFFFSTAEGVSVTGTCSAGGGVGLG